MVRLFPYWWWVWIGQRWSRGVDSPLVGEYVKFRQGLMHATVSGGRVTSPVASNLEDPNRAIEWLYGVLSVLDAKASALMRLNGVMLAAAAFLLSFRHPAGLQIPVGQWLILSIAVLSSFSIALCLLVVSVDWRFLGLVRQTGQEFDFTDEIANLQRVSLFRQGVYRLAWWLSFAATGLFVYTFVRLLVW
jgi:hypothetical protein